MRRLRPRPSRPAGDARRRSSLVSVMPGFARELRKILDRLVVLSEHLAREDDRVPFEGRAACAAGPVDPLGLARADVGVRCPGRRCPGDDDDAYLGRGGLVILREHGPTVGTASDAGAPACYAHRRSRIASCSMPTGNVRPAIDGEKLSVPEGCPLRRGGRSQPLVHLRRQNRSVSTPCVGSGCGAIPRASATLRSRRPCTACGLGSSACAARSTATYTW